MFLVPSHRFLQSKKWPKITLEYFIKIIKDFFKTVNFQKFKFFNFKVNIIVNWKHYIIYYCFKDFATNIFDTAVTNANEYLEIWLYYLLPLLQYLFFLLLAVCETKNLFTTLNCLFASSIAKSTNQNQIFICYLYLSKLIILIK